MAHLRYTPENYTYLSSPVVQIAAQRFLQMTVGTGDALNIWDNCMIDLGIALGILIRNYRKDWPWQRQSRV